MTTSPPPAPHDPSPYQERTDGSYANTAAETFTTAEARHGIVLVTGPCPQCRGEMEIVLVNTVFAGRDDGPAPPPPDGSSDPSSRLFMCTCPLEHAGRPEGYSGCGAYWKMIVEVAA